jgi:hypothetical protein
VAKTKLYDSVVKQKLFKGDDGRIVRDLQDAANTIIVAHQFPWMKMIEDGGLGPDSIRKIHFAGWLLGLSARQLRNIKDGQISPHVQKLIRRERRRGPNLVRIDKKRRPRVDRMRKLHFNVDPDGDGLAVFEGTTVAAWIKPWLEKARAEGWTGWLTSGWRDPLYSEQLCYSMCGSPSCPGRCAGRSSNHSGKGSKNGDPGAVDLTDYYNFGRIMAKLDSPLHNSIGPSDPVHFSASGN